MQSRPRKIAALVLPAVLAVGGAYTVYWYSAASEVRAAIDRWVAERTAAGWEVSLSEPRLGGFPSRIEVAIADGKIAGPEGPSRWRWELPPVTASARPWAPGNIAIDARGRHRIATGDGPLVARFAAASSDIVAGPGSIRDAMIRLGGVEIDLPDGTRVAAGLLNMHLREHARIDEDAAGSPETGTGVAFDARALSIPAEWRPALGTSIARVSLDAVVAGTADLHGTFRDLLERWRDAGGTLEVRALAVDWQKLSLRAEGTFALDENLQPQGAMTADIEGVDPTADALIAAGLIDSQTAFAAKVANKALTLGGGPARLPLTIQRQRLYLGPVPLLDVPAVEWE
ncbi:MAG: DUF2125 domain-containing protein [Rhodospirillaceae bacterium]